jgi:hypothetical protein
MKEKYSEGKLFIKKDDSVMGVKKRNIDLVK